MRNYDPAKIGELSQLCGSLAAILTIGKENRVSLVVLPVSGLSRFSSEVAKLHENARHDRRRLCSPRGH
jgi:hypothetical protein